MTSPASLRSALERFGLAAVSLVTDSEDTLRQRSPDEVLPGDSFY